MAIKAGLVGVNPKGVDKNGMPLGAKGTVNETQLTANGKQFHFAYDSTTEKYGYKLDGTGDFIPFESAGGSPGWVKPAELIHEGITFESGLTYISGGYYVDTDNNMCYIDMIYKKDTSGSKSITGLPKCNVNCVASIYRLAALPNDINDFFTKTLILTSITGTNALAYTYFNDNIGNTDYRRLIVEYPITV